MKKNILRTSLVLLLTTVCLLSACQKNEPANVADNQPTDSLPVYVFEEESYNDSYDYDIDEWVQDAFKIRYELTLNSNSEAELSITNIYNDEPDYILTHYTGTYERDNDLITFSYSEFSDIYAFTFENDKIVASTIYYSSGINEDLAGTYTGTSDEYGDFTLSIDKYYQATLTTDKYELDGRVYLYDGKYDLVVSNDAEDLFIDWFIELNDDKVTYVPFTVSHSNYEGNYTIFGDLGTLNLFVDDQGNCSIEMNLDDNYQYLTGYVYGGTEDLPFTGAYLSNDEYDIDLYLEDINNDGTFNYSGRVSKMLSAG